MLNRLALTLGLLALTFAPQLSRADSTLYGIEYFTGTGFYTVSQSSGALTFLGNTGNPATGDLTSNLTTTIYSNDMTNSTLLTINPANGAITSTVSIMNVAGAPVNIVSLAWDPVSHLLYGNTSVGFGGTVHDSLYQIDAVTGIATFVGDLGYDRVYALGFDNSGSLYGISNQDHVLITINTSSGAGTLIAPVGLGLLYDLAFRPGDNVMFVADSGTTSLYTMDPTTGVSTLVGPYGDFQNVVGLAFLEGQVPEPGSLLLFGTGLSGLAGMVRRRLRK